MHAEQYRNLYEYHFMLNRKFWDFSHEHLSWAQLVEQSQISVGSIRNVFVHIMSVDNRWFSGLRKIPDPGHIRPEQFENAEDLRVRWDLIEAEMRIFLDGLGDSTLEQQFDDDLKVWHVLSHVVNHGTAHRAQIGAMLRLLHLKPPPQDYILYVLGKI